MKNKSKEIVATPRVPGLTKDEVSQCLIAAKLFYTRQITQQTIRLFGIDGLTNNTAAEINNRNIASVIMSDVWDKESKPICDELLAAWQAMKEKKIAFNPDEALPDDIQDKIQTFANEKFGENIKDIMEKAAQKTEEGSASAKNNISKGKKNSFTAKLDTAINESGDAKLSR